MHGRGKPRASLAATGVYQAHTPQRNFALDKLTSGARAHCRRPGAHGLVQCDEYGYGGAERRPGEPAATLVRGESVSPEAVAGREVGRPEAGALNQTSDEQCVERMSSVLRLVHRAHARTYIAWVQRGAGRNGRAQAARRRPAKFSGAADEGAPDVYPQPATRSSCA
jgi:hypothetical protein